MSGQGTARQQVDTLTTAWEWVLRLRGDDASPEDVAAWLQWYEADARHREAFEEMQAFWRDSGALASNSRDVEALLGDSPVTQFAVPVSTAPARRGLVAWGAAATLAAAASIALVVNLDLFSSPDAPQSARLQHLPDGSTVQLATRSVVEVQFTARERVLEMRPGEAFFTVSKDPTRPFIVHVGDLQVRAVGTAFNIRHADARTVVTVTEGAVDVRKDGDSVRVSAGARYAFDARAGRAETGAADAARALAWQHGRLEYLNEPLAAVIADINRYSSYPVTIGDAKAGDTLFSGTVFTADTDNWIRALPSVFPINVQLRDGSAVVTSRQ